jgi:Uma2 family endonuclease
MEFPVWGQCPHPPLLIWQRININAVLYRLYFNRLDDYSEPEPDIAVVRVNAQDYEDHHPTSEDIYLLIEVADTTLKRDLEIKAPTYARSGVLEYWVLDIQARQLYVFRSPTVNGYEQEAVLSEGDTISPIAFPDGQIVIREMLTTSIG